MGGRRLPCRRRERGRRAGTRRYRREQLDFDLPMTDTLTITDNRTGKNYELPIQDGTIRAMDLRQIKAGAEDFGLMTYDPAFMNTANCRSSITFIDAEKSILLYRG